MKIEQPSPVEINTPLNLSIKLDSVEAKPFELKAFGIFEGGGAKGLAHVGAFSALEERGVKFIGVAGTSAGAIVASLVGAGYNANELFIPNPEKPDGIFNVDFTTFLTSWKWNCFCIARAISRWGKKHWYAKLFLFVIPLLIIYEALLYLSVWLLNWLDASYLLFVFFSIIAVIILAANRLFPLFGYFSTSDFCIWLNEQLCKKIYPGQPIRDIAFKDMPIPITIVASDLHSKKIVTFNKKETPKYKVAAAVAASISIPGAFKPIVDGDMVLVDGGMLSNFPAWALDNEAETQTDIVPTFGFRLNPVSTKEPKGFPSDKRKTFLGYALALLRTAFLGENILEARQVLDLSQIPLTVSVGTLDFDLTDKQKCALYEEGKKCADEFYRFDYIGPKDPRPIRETFEFLETTLKQTLNRPEIHLRVNLALPIEPNKRKLRLLYSYNMNDDYDDRLILGLEEGAIGSCWQAKDTIIVDMTDAKKTYSSKWKMTKYQQRMVRDKLQTLISIPVFNPKILDKTRANKENELLAVLSIDSDDDLTEDFIPLKLNDTKSNLVKLINVVCRDLAAILRS